MPETWTPLLVSVVGIAVFLYGISKTAMPGVGMVSGPILAAALGPTIASGFVVPLLIVGDLIGLALYRQHVQWRLIGRLIPGLLIGFAATALLFRFVDDATLSRILGVLILISLALELLRLRSLRRGQEQPEITARPHPVVAGLFGVLAGMTTMAANAGGAAMTVYLVKMRVPMLAFMGTSVWFFFFLNLLKVPIVVWLGLLDVESLIVDLWFLPVLVAGAGVGILIFRRLDQRAFTSIALLLSGVAAVWLVVHG